LTRSTANTLQHSVRDVLMTDTSRSRKTGTHHVAGRSKTPYD
jgi:hypothetical protein